MCVWVGGWVVGCVWVGGWVGGCVYACVCVHVCPHALVFVCHNIMRVACRVFSSLPKMTPAPPYTHTHTHTQGALKHLATLDLRQNMIGSDGAKTLAHTVLAGGFPVLTHLYVMQNDIHDQGVAALYKAFTARRVMCPLIQCVNVRQNPGAKTPLAPPCPIYFQV